MLAYVPNALLKFGFFPDGEARIRATAPPHEKEPADMIWAPGQYPSGPVMRPRRCWRGYTEIPFRKKNLLQT